MSRLYDRMMASGILAQSDTPVKFTEAGWASLQRATVIDITNVAQYMYAADTEWSLHDFPNLAPPFGECFFEYQLDSRVREWWAADTRSIGVLLKGDDIVSDNARWAVNLVSYMEREKRKGVYQTFCYEFTVDKQGSVLIGNDAPFHFGSLCGTFENVEALRQLARLIFWPCLLAISFLHCKNVKLLDEPIPPKLAKAYQRRHGQPMVRYKTLEIMPMKEVLRREGKSETLGLKKALHICRGHFADYTEKGLFGRHHGIYWWDAHVRGKAEQGVVVKDYRIKKPVGTTNA